MIIPTIISRLFEPSVILVCITLMAVYFSNITNPIFWMLTGIMIILPVAYFIYKLTITHEISNIDISDRRERIRPLLVFEGLLLADLTITYLFGNEFLFRIFILYVVWVLGFLVITLYWKISGHSGVSTLAYCLLLNWYGRGLWPLIFIVFLISWARVVRRDHTLLQVVAGIIYSIAVFGIWKTIM